MPRTKKTKSTARFGARYGTKVKSITRKIEAKQRKKQSCPFCTRKAIKRLASGIWSCKKCNKKFASDAYNLNN